MDVTPFTSSPDFETVELPFESINISSRNSEPVFSKNSDACCSKSNSRWQSLKKNAKTVRESMVFRKTPPSRNSQEARCNCLIVNSCPFQGQCQLKNSLYRAVIIYEGESKTFLGHSPDELKNRFNRFESHVAVYTGNCEHVTEMVKFANNLKSKHIDYDVKWNVPTDAEVYEMLRKNLKREICIDDMFENKQSVKITNYK